MAMIPLPGVGGTLFGGGSTGVPTAGLPEGGSVQSPGGKASTIQNLGSPHSGQRSTITRGDPLSRMTGNYGKGHSFDGAMGGHSKNPASVSQTNPALHGIRGGLGQMRRIRGGLGPGKVGQAGGSSDYSMTSPDME